MVAVLEVAEEAAEQRDEADEGRLVARRGMVVGGHRDRTAIVSEGAGARPSQLIASVMNKEEILHILAWIFILGGLLIGGLSVLHGVKKAKNERSKFILLGFLRKCHRKTPFNEFTGYEMVGLGVLSFLSSALIWLLLYGKR